MMARAREIKRRESKAFASRTPRSAEWLVQARTLMPNGVPMAWMAALQRHPPVVAVRGAGSRFWDLDGNEYLDFNVADQSMAAGFASAPIVAAIARQAALGNHFLLPTAEAMEVCRLLTEQFGLPQWQFTLSASGANTDALRLARVATGRSAVLIFDGKYHGHVDQILWSSHYDSSSDGPAEAAWRPMRSGWTRNQAAMSTSSPTTTQPRCVRGWPGVTWRQCCSSRR